MSRPLSYRRAQEKRALQKAYRIVLLWYPRESFHRGGLYGVKRTIFTPEDRWDMARRIAGNRKKCDGDCCKNPRRVGYEEPRTYQELKASEDYEYQLKDYYEISKEEII